MENGGASALSVHLLGEVGIECDGAPVALPASRKTRALFVYLLLNPRPHRRERLCEIFWDLPDDPRGALRWSLSKVRAMLRDCAHWIVADREHVQCVAPDAAIDLRQLAAIVERDDPADAAALRALTDRALEPPLMGVELPNNATYTAWLRAEQAEADRLRAVVLRRVADDAGSAESAAHFRSVADAIDGGETPVRSEPSRGTSPANQESVSRLRSTQTDKEQPPPDQTIRYCTAPDGARIAYAELGQGPPLVKAANWLNHLEFDLTSPIWGRMFRSLADRHRFVRYDERGNGLSEWDVADLSFDSFVRDLETVVDRLGMERFALLGISQGCAVSVEYAARHPERVSKLVLIGGYAAGWRVNADAGTSAEREAIITLTRRGWGQDNPVYRQLFSQTFMPSGTADELDWFNDFQRRTASAENAARFLEAFADIDVRHRLADVRAPTLVIHSRGDQRVPLDKGIELASQIPNASLVTIDSDSHLPLSREPAMDVMIERIEAFLAE